MISVSDYRIRNVIINYHLSQYNPDLRRWVIQTSKNILLEMMKKYDVVSGQSVGTTGFIQFVMFSRNFSLGVSPIVQTAASCNENVFNYCTMEIESN